MYCPRCGAENRPTQKFCRQCGLSLPSVRLAMEGAVDEAMVTMAKEMDRLSGGSATLAIFALIALLTSLFSDVSTAINLLLGLLIGGPMIYRGIKSTARLLDRMEPEKLPLSPPPHPRNSFRLLPPPMPINSNYRSADVSRLPENASDNGR